jgi:hypothetical protein
MVLPDSIADRQSECYFGKRSSFIEIDYSQQWVKQLQNA